MPIAQLKHAWKKRTVLLLVVGYNDNMSTTHPLLRLRSMNDSLKSTSHVALVRTTVGQGGY